MEIERDRPPSYQEAVSGSVGYPPPAYPDGQLGATRVRNHGGSCCSYARRSNSDKAWLWGIISGTTCVLTMIGITGLALVTSTVSQDENPNGFAGSVGATVGMVAACASSTLVGTCCYAYHQFKEERGA